MTDIFTKTELEKAKMKIEIGYMTNTVLVNQVKEKDELSKKVDSEMDTVGSMMKAHETALAQKEKTLIDFVKNQEEALAALKNAMKEAD